MRAASAAQKLSVICLQIRIGSTAGRRTRNHCASRCKARCRCCDLIVQRRDPVPTAAQVSQLAFGFHRFGLRSTAANRYAACWASLPDTLPAIQPRPLQIRSQPPHALAPPHVSGSNNIHGCSAICDHFAAQGCNFPRVASSSC